MTGRAAGITETPERRARGYSAVHLQSNRWRGAIVRGNSELRLCAVMSTGAVCVK